MFFIYHYWSKILLKMKKLDQKVKQIAFNIGNNNKKYKIKSI